MNTKVGKWLIDEQSHSITHGDVTISLNLAAFKLLQLFIANPGEIIPLAKIKEQIWETEFTTDNLVYQTIRALRKALEGDSGKSYIKTVPRHGYQLLVSIETFSPPPENIVEKTAEAKIKPEKATFFLSRRIFALAISCLLLIALVTRFWFNKPELVPNSGGHLVFVEHKLEVAAQEDQIIKRYQSSIAKALNTSGTKLAANTALLTKLDQLDDTKKLVIKFLPKKKAVLNLLFVGKPSRLAHLSIQPLSKLVDEQSLAAVSGELLKVFHDPALKQDNSGIAELVNGSRQVKALASLSFDQPGPLAQARRLIGEEIEKNSLNEQQKKAKYYFIDALYAFYRIEYFEDQHLSQGINYLLSHYNQSSYSLIAAAFYLANQDNVAIAFELLKNLDQDPFITFIQGLFHLELDEELSALKHFEKGYNRDRHFEDNSYFYFKSLVLGKRRQELAAIYPGLEHENYLSTNIYYVFYDWLMINGNYTEAMKLLARFSGQLLCNTDLYGNMALLNNSLLAFNAADTWQQHLAAIDNRDWRIPWLTYVQMLNENKLSAYPLWYGDYRKSILGEDTFADPLILSFFAQLALGEYQEVNHALPLLASAEASFNSMTFIEIATAVIDADIARQEGKNENLARILAPVKEQALAFEWDELALINQVLASYFTLYRDLTRAEVHLVDGCHKNPAICLGWQNIPLLTPVMQTDKLQQAQARAEQLIHQSREQLNKLNEQITGQCAIADT
ncbi:winged helix-turn-helix domain-containing protein [Thalassomonas actiniarum]|uniref:Winged helix-turn-helix transcriptional regulator n=1 Tax=Thalassomonas actiniarum TaxID=485447 RepID=A0AAE9YWG7_9GAMM|nr:winged helix-turn-helix domain-containing protein [Thalassomonas actiniarum]WDE02440.1 winged helix-turn-helix transcriptional regulator [Thalassomonas actiniarum]